MFLCQMNTIILPSPVYCGISIGDKYVNIFYYADDIL